MLRKLGLVVLFVSCLAACAPDQATVAPTLESTPVETPIPVPSATPAAAPVKTLTPAETASPPDTPIPEGGAPSREGRIAFYSHRDGNVEIYTMRPDGSDQRRLTFNESDDYSPAWSPDGSRIVFLSDREDPNPTKCAHDCFYQLYVMNADGSDEHKLVETDFTVQHPDWHPDGTRISFDTEFNLQGDIYVVRADGNGLQLLIEDGFWADWSPDGTQVVFASKRDGNVELYMADADGSNQRRLTENGQLDYFPDWSPDGQRIAFARLEKKQIYVMNADGSNEQQLTHQSNAENPSWSPDGTLIAFQSSSGGNFDIYVLNVEEALRGGEGSAARRLTNHSEGDLWPSWGVVATQTPTQPISLDGRGGGFIAFYSERDGDAEIYIMNADGSAETRLTHDHARDIVPDLSPDGSQIVFVSDRDGNDEVYRMNRDGSDVVRLTNTPAEDAYPYWSPDGTQIIFCSQRDDGRTYEVYLMNSDGTDQTRITDNAVSEEWAYLSPDMQKIVYAVGPFPGYSLYVMDVDGSDPQQIFSSDQNAALPKWSRDARTIAFNHFTLSSGNIVGDVFSIDYEGGDIRQITASGGNSVSENPYWSPDGSRIVFQSNQTGNFQIYVMDADGGNQVRLTNHRGNDYWPSWGGTSSSGDRYLGQVPPGMDVQVFAPGIVSIGEGKEYKITFSPDLREILFTRRTPNGRDDRIWYSRLENGALTTPELAPFAHDSLEMDPSFAPDGNRVYFNSQRPLPGEGTSSTRFNVWFVDRTEDGWSAPQFLGSPINDYRPVYFSFADDGTLYFTNSNPREIWYAEWIDGQYAEAQRLPDEINDLPNVAHPAIAPDESYIIVDSYVQKGGRLVGSLYVSFKRADGSWTEALSMAEVLGASETDVYASARITPDGRYLFFERYLPETDRADIYWVGTKVIEALRDEALSAADDWPITVGLYVDAGAHSACTTAAANMFKWMGFNVERIRAADINEGDLSAIDLLYFAGGSAGPYQQDITAAGKEKIRQRIQAGGCFIGTCAGALFAGERAVWDGDADPGETLGLFPGTVEGPIPQIFAENGICQVNLEPHAITGATPEPVWILYYNSPFFQPNSGAAVDVIDRYDITGYPAIVASAYGQGRVVLTGPHPEWEEDDDRDGISYFDHFDDQGSEWDLMRQASLWCLRRMDG